MQPKQTHTPHTHHQVLMGRVTVDIKEWVANGRFEGEQRLHNSEGEGKMNKCSAYVRSNDAVVLFLKQRMYMFKIP
jgi:hypothetical protein